MQTIHCTDRHYPCCIYPGTGVQFDSVQFSSVQLDCSDIPGRVLTMVLNFDVLSNRVEPSEHTESLADFIAKTMMF